MMDKKRIALGSVVMVKSNMIDIDSRMIKEYNTIKRFNSDVTLLCWNREGKKKFSDDYSPIETLNIKAPYGIKYLFLLPIWILYTFFKLLFMKYDVIHVLNFDSYISGILVAKIRKKKIIYEIEDTYIDQISMPSLIRYAILFVDRYLSKFADAIILVDECQIQEFGEITNSNIHVVYDAPPDFSHTFSKNINDSDPFKIYYPGIFFRARKLNIDKIINFVLKTDNVHLTISGYGDMEEEIDLLAKQRPDKITYLGWLESRTKLFQTMYNSDLTFAFKDTSVPLNRYICGSKVFEAMMCSVPIIVNANTSVARKVKEHDCGVVVNAKNQNDVERALIDLINNRQNCKRLGDNGRKAYLQKFHWNIMEKSIEKLYINLLEGGVD